MQAASYSSEVHLDTSGRRGLGIFGGLLVFLALLLRGLLLLLRILVLLLAECRCPHRDPR